MKQCPVCKATYADETLSFCLADGSTLFAVPDEEQTRLISSGNNPLRIEVARATSPVFTPPVTSSQPAPTNSSKTVGILAGLLVLLLLAFAGFAAFMFLKPSDDKKPDIKISPTTTSSQTPDDEIAKLKKQVEDLKNQKSPTPVPTISTPKQTGNSARVNSPSDGFLALRSEPDSETGYRIAQIPHGSSVNVSGCQSNSVKIGSRTGRWCQVSYSGQSGWAFDAWLIY